MLWLVAQESRKNVSQYLAHQPPRALEGVGARMDARKLMPDMEPSMTFYPEFPEETLWINRQKPHMHELPDYSPRDFD
jgi:hypothetical protein